MSESKHCEDCTADPCVCPRICNFCGEIIAKEEDHIDCLGQSDEEEQNKNMKPALRVSAVDGNVYVVIGAVSKALRRSGNTEAAKEFRSKALGSDSYEKVLALTWDYVRWY